MTKKLKLPQRGVALICMAGVGTLGLDGFSKAFDIKNADDHEIFALTATATSGATLVVQNTVTGELIDIPPMTEATLYGDVKRR